MTRDDAIDKLSADGAWLLNSQNFLTALEALGLIKFDEPPAVTARGVIAGSLARTAGQSIDNRITQMITHLYENGFRVVNARGGKIVQDDIDAMVSGRGLGTVRVERPPDEKSQDVHYSEMRGIFKEPR